MGMHDDGNGRGGPALVTDTCRDSKGKCDVPGRGIAAVATVATMVATSAMMTITMATSARTTTKATTVATAVAAATQRQLWV